MKYNAQEQFNGKSYIK